MATDMNDILDSVNPMKHTDKPKQQKSQRMTKSMALAYMGQQDQDKKKKLL